MTREGREFRLFQRQHSSMIKKRCRSELWRLSRASRCPSGRGREAGDRSHRTLFVWCVVCGVVCEMGCCVEWSVNMYVSSVAGCFERTEMGGFFSKHRDGGFQSFNFPLRRIQSTKEEQTGERTERRSQAKHCSQIPRYFPFSPRIRRPKNSREDGVN